MMFGLEFMIGDVFASIAKPKKKLELIYLAGPYTHRTKSVMQWRCNALTKIAAIMVSEGRHVWSPITESHQYSLVLGIDGKWEYWKEHDLLMLSKCDTLYVAKLNGWEKSVGVAAEIEAAKELGMPIRYIDPLDYIGDK